MDNDPNETMTKEDLHAAGATVGAADVEQSHLNPAPTDTSGKLDRLESFMHEARARFTQLEAIVGVASPEFGALAGLAGDLVPAVKPLTDHVPQIAAAVEGILAGLKEAFGEKINVPPPGSTAPAGPT